MKITVTVFPNPPVCQPMCKGKCNGQGNPAPNQGTIQ